MLADFHHLLLFWFPLFLTFTFVIDYFQFVNFTYLFQPSNSPLRKTHKSIFQRITSNGRYGGGGF